MKRYLTSLLLSIAGTCLLGSCSKDQSKIYYSSGSAPVLTADVSDSIALPVTDTTANAVTFTWTNPNYQFSDGVSSLNVTYYLEFDTTSSFNSANMQTVAISSVLTKTFTVSSLNNILANGLQLSTGSAHTVLVRLEAFLSPYTSGSATIAPGYSGTLSFQVTPYAPPPTVAPPSSDTLYITGSATPLGWMSGGQPASVAGQGMTRVTPLLYKITMPLIGGQQFLLVPVAGDWNNKYATDNSSAQPTGGTFSFNSKYNFNGPAASGTYTVTFNFQTGTYTITQ